MSAVVGPGTRESEKGRSPADIYEVADDVRLHRLQPTGTDLYPVPIVLVEDVQTEVLGAGHVGIMAGNKARHVLWPTLAAWLAARSEAAE